MEVFGVCGVRRVRGCGGVDGVRGGGSSSVVSRVAVVGAGAGGTDNNVVGVVVLLRSTLWLNEVRSCRRERRAARPLPIYTTAPAADSAVQCSPVMLARTLGENGNELKSHKMYR